MFSNQIVNIDSIPSVDTATLKPISKAYLKVIILNKLFMCTIALAILVLGKFFVTKEVFHDYFWFIFSLVIGLCIMNFALAVFAFKKRKYAIREHDVIYAKGLLVYSITTVPISRIQHIEESRSWLARQFGLATLNLYTAGESGSDLNISGLPHEEAKQLNDFISARINANS